MNTIEFQRISATFRKPQLPSGRKRKRNIKTHLILLPPITGLPGGYEQFGGPLPEEAGLRGFENFPDQLWTSHEIRFGGGVLFTGAAEFKSSARRAVV